MSGGSEGFWGSSEGITLRLGMLSGSINTGSYNNALQVYAPAYGVQYFKMSGPQPKCEYCTRYYGRIYRQGMFMPEFPSAPKLRSHLGCLVSMGKRARDSTTRFMFLEVN